MIKMMYTTITEEEDTNDIEAIQVYKDAIDVTYYNNNTTLMNQYIKNLKTKFGVDYNPKRNLYPSEYYTINEVGDFRRYQFYCQERYEWKYKSFVMKNYDKPAFSNRVLNTPDYEILNEFGIKIIKKSFSGTENARVSGLTTTEIEVKDNFELDLITLLHEMGHLFDNKIRKHNTPAHDMAESPSSYGCMNAGETFAENFCYFFSNPTWLKKINKPGFDWMNSNITDEYMILVDDLLNT